MRIQFGLSIGLGIALVSGAFAETPIAARAEHGWQLSALMDCRQIVAVVERLSCYDAAMGGDGGLHQPASLQHRPGVSASWRLHHGRDPFSDADLSSVRLWPIATGGDRDAEGLLALAVSCTGEGDRQISVRMSGYLGILGQGLPVRYRFGTGPTLQEIWDVSPTEGELFAPERSSFVKGLAQDAELLLEVTNYRGQRIWARYPGQLGGRAALHHVLSGCGAPMVEAALAAESAGGL